MIFPQKGVRFIAINDGGTAHRGNDFAPLRNILTNGCERYEQENQGSKTL